MMKVVVALMVSSAFGFQGPQTVVRSSALEAMSKSVPFLVAPKNLDGYVGNEEFDPLGFGEMFDMKYLREAEIKNGRVAMLAIVGCLAPEFGLHFPGEAFSHANPIVAAVSVPPAAWGALIFAAGCVESYSNNGKMSYLDMFEEGRQPGSFDFDGGMLKGGDADRLYLSEIVHCRLAMIAIGGLLHGAFVTNADPFGNPFSS